MQLMEKTLGKFHDGTEEKREFWLTTPADCVSYEVHLNQASSDLSSVASPHRNIKDKMSDYMTLDKYYGFKQLPGEGVMVFIERIQAEVDYRLPWEREVKEELMKDLLVFGMQSDEARKKITAKNAGWEEAKEIAQEDEDKEIYEYAIREEEKEKKEKEKNARERKLAQKSKEKIAKVPDQEQEKYALFSVLAYIFKKFMIDICRQYYFHLNIKIMISVFSKLIFRIKTSVSIQGGIIYGSLLIYQFTTSSFLQLSITHLL